MKIRMLDGSGFREYRYTFEDVDRHGNTRIYFRRKGRSKTRLRARPGTVEFDREYQAAYAGNPTTGQARGAREPSAGSLLWLCQRYWESQTFRALNEKTRRVRRRVLQLVCDEVWPDGPVGSFPYRLMDPPAVRELRDARAEFPDAANQRVATVRALFKWACDPENDLAKTNPAVNVKYLPSKNLDGHKPWTIDDVEKYWKRHPIGTKARLAIDLLLYTGVRRSDVLIIGPHMERDGKLVFEETKGKGRIKKLHRIPILPPLRQSIDAIATIGQRNYLISRYGKQFSETGFSKWFKQCCKDAGLDAGLSAHGVRKLSVQICAEGGATTEQLKALYGWRATRSSETYTKGANAELLETEAAKILDRKMNKKVPHLSVLKNSVGQKS